jgi:hypothetical protein
MKAYQVYQLVTSTSAQKMIQLQNRYHVRRRHCLLLTLPDPATFFTDELLFPWEGLLSNMQSKHFDEICEVPGQEWK